MPTPAHIWRPSNARVVVLDDFLPVPRGATTPTPPPLSWPAKDPGDVLDYQLNLAPALIGNEGDAITALDVAITPTGVGGLNLLSTAADGEAAVLWLSQGQAGTTYSLAVTVSTSNGRTISRNVLLPVRGLSAPLPSSFALEIGPGAALTDETGADLLLLS